MSELISGEEALIALANGEDVEFKCGGMSWSNLDAKQQPLEILIDKNVVFRLKPRTVNLNGVDVGQPESCDWNFNDPSDVVLKFKSREEALHFHENILKIFSAIK